MQTTPGPSAEFVIAGGGTAGCVLAARLSEAGHSVLVLEAGGTHDRFFVNMPLGYGKLFHDDSLNWSYTTAPDAQLGGRTDYWPRGKLLGGSSAINAMVYIRGQPEDYDGWARMGNDGWSWNDVLPYFLRSEDNDLGASEWHGSGGPLKVSSIGGRHHPLVQRVIDAGKFLGHPENTDFNGARQEGFGLYQFTFRNGRRVSNAHAFLNGVRRSPNVKVITGAVVERIIFEGTRAVGVEYLQKGQRWCATATREVVVAAGAIASPTLLQRSGIGPGALLHRLGIPVVHDNGEVGANLQDHAQSGFAFRTQVPSLNERLRSPFGQAFAGLQYLLSRTGPLTLSINQGGGFFCSRPGLERPDCQLYILPMSFATNPGKEKTQLRPDAFSGLTMTVSPCRPESRGQVEILSSDPDVAPLIQPNYLSTPEDMRVMVDSLKLLLQLAAARPLAQVIHSRARPPEPLDSDEALAAHARANCKTTYHPSCTCAMGPDPQSSVVDPALRVHGVHGLRVIDASVMPNVISGNTSAPTTMIAEKGADMLRAAHPR